MTGTTLRRASGLLLLALCVAGCSGHDTPSGPPLKLTIAEASQPVFALIYVADAKGFLRQAGLDVTFTSFSLGRDALNSVLEGKSDLATVFETPVAGRIYEGKDLAILSMLHTSTRNQALLARRDRGISSAADLKDKRVGLSPGTNLDYVLSVILATEGVPAERVTQVPLELAAYEKALLSGEVDAVMTFQPYLSLLRRTLGGRALVLYSDSYVESSLLVGTREVVAGKPESMKRLTSALAKSEDYLQHHEEECIRLVVSRLAGRFSEESIREGWGNVKLEAKLDNVLVSTMQLEAQWMKDTGRFSGPVPDFRKALITDYLRSVKPDAVTVQSLRPSR